MCRDGSTPLSEDWNCALRVVRDKNLRPDLYPQCGAAPTRVIPGAPKAREGNPSARRLPREKSLLRRRHAADGSASLALIPQGSPVMTFGLQFGSVCHRWECT